MLNHFLVTPEKTSGRRTATDVIRADSAGFDVRRGSQDRHGGRAAPAVGTKKGRPVRTSSAPKIRRAHHPDDAVFPDEPCVGSAFPSGDTPSISTWSSSTRHPRFVSPTRSVPWDVAIRLSSSAIPSRCHLHRCSPGRLRTTSTKTIEGTKTSCQYPSTSSRSCPKASSRGSAPSFSAGTTGPATSRSSRSRTWLLRGQAVQLSDASRIRANLLGPATPCQWHLGGWQSRRCSGQPRRGCGRRRGGPAPSGSTTGAKPWRRSVQLTAARPHPEPSRSDRRARCSWRARSRAKTSSRCSSRTWRTFREDERPDAVLFSLAFAADERGTVPLNWGPISRIGGERDSTSPYTRAEEQIDRVLLLRPARTRLVRLMSRKAWQTSRLPACRTQWSPGRSGARAEARDLHLSDIEHELRHAGLEVHTHVGLSDFTGCSILPFVRARIRAWIALMLDGPAWAGRCQCG